MLEKGDIRTVELAAASGAGLPSIHKLLQPDSGVLNMQLNTLIRISAAMGCSPVEILPVLAKRSKTGLLYDRGVFKKTR
jgi:hypothetical protein